MPSSSHCFCRLASQPLSVLNSAVFVGNSAASIAIFIGSTVDYIQHSSADASIASFSSQTFCHSLVFLLDTSEAVQMLAVVVQAGLLGLVQVMHLPWARLKRRGASLLCIGIGLLAVIRGSLSASLWQSVPGITGPPTVETLAAWCPALIDLQASPIDSISSAFDHPGMIAHLAIAAIVAAALLGLYITLYVCLHVRKVGAKAQRDALVQKPTKKPQSIQVSHKSSQVRSSAKPLAPIYTAFVKLQAVAFDRKIVHGSCATAAWSTLQWMVWTSESAYRLEHTLQGQSTNPASSTLTAARSAEDASGALEVAGIWVQLVPVIRAACLAIHPFLILLADADLRHAVLLKLGLRHTDPFLVPPQPLSAGDGSGSGSTGTGTGTGVYPSGVVGSVVVLKRARMSVRQSQSQT
ncbi:hypothetical protein BC831DRAFT_199620 [Entophlyctis helioformis]|nr:hypothetical protein BC831DRAFT_199620 [Entophlyctis helioformis]